MKKSNRHSSRRRHPKKALKETNVACNEDEFWLTAKALLEPLSVSDWIRNYYVLSRFWAWVSQIKTKDRLSIPVPRFLTYREP